MFSPVIILLIVLMAHADAFLVKNSAFKGGISRVRTGTTQMFVGNSESKPPLEVTAVNPALIAIAVQLMTPFECFAKGGEYGILEGRTASMLHPVTMLALFATSVYSGYLGLQWRKLRETGEKIKSLKGEIPELSTGEISFPLSKAITAVSTELASLKAAGDAVDRTAVLEKDLATLRSVVPLEAELSELSTLRKDLIAANLRDKHWTTGSVLLGVGVMVSLLGAFNTYMRSGKLFPGPHLYAGMGITILWALAAALVPAMQKGNEAARIGHIALNSVNVLLFAWQVGTGLEIMIKVWGFTQWP